MLNVQFYSFTLGKSMNEYRIGLDGVTINRTLDLILDFPHERDAKSRRFARPGFEQALNQFVSAALFADRLVFDKSIAPGSTREDAATEFMKRLDIAASKTEPFIVFDSPPSPERLLASPKAVAKLKTVLSSIEQTIVDNERDWLDLMIREVVNYLGTDRSLAFNDLRPYEYVFANGKRDFFVTEKSNIFVRPILEAIPQSAIDRLIYLCRDFSGETSKGALEEFFRRNLFAHLLIGENFASHLDSRNSSSESNESADPEQRRSNNGFSDVWAAPTREVLQATTPGQAEFGQLDKNNDISVILPYGVETVLRHVARSNVKATLIAGILEVRQLAEYKALRSLLYEVRTSPSEEARRNIRTITREINNKTNSRGTLSINMSISTGSNPILPKIAFDVLRPVPRWIGASLPRRLRARWAGKYLSITGRKDEVQDAIDRHLKRIFPNTFA
jgi:hypothetical protein